MVEERNLQMPIQVTYYSRRKRGVQKISISSPESAGPIRLRDFLPYVARNGGMDLTEIESSLDEEDSQRTVLIALNGRNIQSLQGMDTLVHDGDTLSMLPVVAGG